MNKNKIISTIFIGLLALLGGYFLLRGNTVQQDTTTPRVSSVMNGADVRNAEGYYDIESTTLIAMQKSKDFALVNVHIPYAGELANTDVFIPFNTIGQNLGKLPSDKNAKIVLYCRSGSMSATAAKELVFLGYTNVYNLTGGMNAWEKSGHTVLRNNHP
ncbi:MAG: rhodanese-like domain-containing protein [Candidatus Yonathbacteria bacterium]|nr:rhodanese-like domain-containing protein [Candidatus Yonathbacteria bacterium]